MTINSDNNINKKNSYLQSSDSLNSKNENENIINELNKEVSLNTKFVKNYSQLTA